DFRSPATEVLLRVPQLVAGLSSYTAFPESVRTFRPGEKVTKFRLNFTLAFLPTVFLAASVQASPQSPGASLGAVCHLRPLVQRRITPISSSDAPRAAATFLRFFNLAFILFQRRSARTAPSPARKFRDACRARKKFAPSAFR